MSDSRPVPRKSRGVRTYRTLDPSAIKGGSDGGGESAAEVARWRREKAERLLKQADAFDRGAEGERETAAVLAQLPATEWHVFHDVRWPGRKDANVDQVAVGPSGVFVVDSKNWSGNVAVKHDVLLQNGRSREKAVVGTAEGALAVAGLVPALDPRLVHPVLCFVREEQVIGWARDVMVCSTANLVPLLLSRPVVLDAQARSALTLDLDAQFQAAAPTQQPRTTGKPRASSSKTPRRRTKQKPSAARALVSLVIIAVCWVISTYPGILVGLADWLTGYFTS